MIDCVGLTADVTLSPVPATSRPAWATPPLPNPLSPNPAGGGAYRRRAWEQVGGFEKACSSTARTSISRCASAAPGGARSWLPAAVAVHLGSATANARSAWQRYQGGFARGYFLRRYRVLRSRTGPRALVTEGIVVVGDAVISHDLSALRGRVAGWRSARGVPPRPLPPNDALDETIGFTESLRLRRVVYAN